MQKRANHTVSKASQLFIAVQNTHTHTHTHTPQEKESGEAGSVSAEPG